MGMGRQILIYSTFYSLFLDNVVRFLPVISGHVRTAQPMSDGVTYAQSLLPLAEVLGSYETWTNRKRIHVISRDPSPGTPFTSMDQP